MTLRMADAVDPAQLPAGMDVYAGYVDGAWPDFAAIKRAHPAARLLSITVNAAGVADVLDIESGDATDDQAPAWWHHVAGAAAVPVLYRSVSGAQGLLEVMAAAHIPRAGFRLWTAHYDPAVGAHLCSSSCGFGFTDRADATQWIDHGGWDESLLADNFFEEAPVALAAPIVCAISRPQGGGWLIGADGGTFPWGGAAQHGNPTGTRLARPIVAAVAAADGEGYTLIGADGGTFRYGSGPDIPSLA